MPLPEAVRNLVARFESNKDHYTAASYNETQTRIEFLDPLFRELGWDIANTQGFAEAYKDVIHEDRVLVAGKKKNPDYAFRVGGIRKFYLEAKKPSLFIGSDTGSAIQLRRYGWSGKMPVSVLSNFAELSIYDTRVAPSKKDTALTARIKRFEYFNFESDWDEIFAILSKEAIQRGSFDKFVASSSKSHQTLEVDDTFLLLIESWRKELAGHVFKRNPGVTVQELREVVQSLIDRIVFLRIAEDRGTEAERSLFNAGAKPHVYESLQKLFIAADKKYNSGLFHLGKWKSSSPTDVLSPTLEIGDRLLKEILHGLYYPQSPYEFSVIPADVLGQVYEKFLGQTIVIKSGAAQIEYRPEVKKAGGVYYTPTYIAEYIVSRTVGSCLGAPEKAGSAPTLRIIDPACGSGSFLLVAYECLLKWYGDYYRSTITVPKAKTDVRLVVDDDGRITLSLSEKKRILTAHIFGVDIDAQAIEVAKLSLHLRMLQGERSAAYSKSGGSVLPDLDANFRQGNALINSSHFDRNPGEASDEERFGVINPFDWEGAFAHGAEFDVVVGNPPYFSVDNTFGAGDTRLASLKALYPDIHTDKTDIYYYFLQKGLDLTSRYVGYICSRAFLEAAKASKLREKLAESGAVAEIVDFTNAVIFEGVGISTAIIIIDRRSSSTQLSVSRLSGAFGSQDRTADGISRASSFARFEYPKSGLSARPWNLAPPDGAEITLRIDEKGEPLGTILELGQGMQTGENAVFGRKSDQDIKDLGIGAGLYKTRVRNTDIRAYGIRPSKEKILYLEDVEDFKQLPPKLRKFLLSKSDALKSRAAFERGNCVWWKFSWPLNREKYALPRIIAPYLATSNRFAVERGFENLGLTDTTVLFDGNQPEALEYICCLLNSRLLTYRFHMMAKLKGAGIYEYFAGSLAHLPIRRINFAIPAEKKLHDELVDLYLALSKTTDQPGPGLQRRDLLQKQVDAAVYKLYSTSEADRVKIDSY